MNSIRGSHQSIEFSGIEIVNPIKIEGTPLVVRNLYANMCRFINGKPIESSSPTEIQNHRDLKNSFNMTLENCRLLQKIIEDHARIFIVNNDMNRTPQGVLVAREYVLTASNHEILARVNETALEMLQASTTGSITLLGVSENAMDHVNIMISNLEHEERLAQIRAREKAQQRAKEAESQRRIQAFNQRKAAEAERKNNLSIKVPIRPSRVVSNRTEEGCHCFSWISNLFSRETHYETINK